MDWQQLHTMEPRQAPPPECGYLLANKQARTKADKWTSCFAGPWLTGKATVAPGPPKTLGKQPRPRWPLPYPAADPTLGAICRSAPCRRPPDLIKCNYHQPLVQVGGGWWFFLGGASCSGGETNIHFLHIFSFFPTISVCCFYLPKGGIRVWIRHIINYSRDERKY